MENTNKKQEASDQIALLKQFLDNAKANLASAYQIIEKIAPDTIMMPIQNKAKDVGKEELTKNAKIIEGVFDGQNMIGPDGKVYAIPPNYVSKSKLVEGDILKLTIMPDGSFLYKQIGPVDRKRLVGLLLKDEDDSYNVLANGRTYKIILAAVTYFKGNVGDQAIILVPKDQDSRWAALENIIKEGTALANGAEIELPSSDNELVSGDDLELPLGSDLELDK